jgi:hypothetical protein
VQHLLAQQERGERYDQRQRRDDDGEYAAAAKACGLGFWSGVNDLGQVWIWVAGQEAVDGRMIDKRVAGQATWQFLSRA